MSWRERAACADPEFDPEWWHPTTETNPVTVELAKAICNNICPVTAICEKKYDGGYGIWGGKVKKVWDTRFDS